MTVRYGQRGEVVYSPMSRGLCTYCLLTVNLTLVQNALVNFRGSFSPPPDRSTRGLLSNIHCQQLVEPLEAKLTNTRILTGSPWSFCLRHTHTGPPAITQLQFRFSYPGSGPFRFLLVGFCSSKSDFCLSNFGSISLPFELTSQKI